MKRREFLFSMGVGGSVVAFSSEQAEAAKSAQADDDLEHLDLNWQKAPCRFCGTGCGVEVGIHDGKAKAVRGDKKSPVNRGLLCVKGYHLPGFLYGADRLQHPMRRATNGKLSRITWDEAIEEIAAQFGKTLKDFGPEAVSIYGSGQWTIFDGYVALKWMKGGMFSNQLEANARICMASAVMGFMTQFGSDEPMGCYEDLDISDDFVLWGNNMAEMHPILYSRMLENKRKNPTVRIVDLSTRRTPTSEYADLYIQFRPGTDLALANGVLHLLMQEDKVDHAFVNENVVFKRGIEDVDKIGYGCYGSNAEKYTFKDQPRPSTYEDAKGFLAAYTPEKVSAITGVSVNQIKTLADIYGDRNRNTVSLWCMGVNQHVRGTWMNNLINNIHLLTGKICRPGSNPLSLTGQPSACGTVREVGTLSNRLPSDMLVMKEAHRAKAEKIWGIPSGSIPSKPGNHTMDMFRALMRKDIKTMWIQTTNPWVSLPNLHRYTRKPGDGRFIVVSDIYPTPTTDVADIILPSAAWIEREGAFGNTERRTQHWNQMISPPGEAREDALQMIQVAKKMGMGHLFPWPENDWHRAAFEEYRSFTLGTGKDLASYDRLRQTRGQLWPVVDGKETRYRYTAGHDPYVKKDKGAHFYKAKKYGERAAYWSRPYHAPAESPNEEYPFWLCTGRVLEHWHTGSMTRRIPQLHQAVPESYVEINSADASRLGFQDGEQVRLTSRRGSMILRAHIDGRGNPPEGSVFVPFFDESLKVNELTLDAMDNISKEPDFKKCAIRIEKI